MPSPAAPVRPSPFAVAAFAAAALLGASLSGGPTGLPAARAEGVADFAGFASTFRKDMDSDRPEARLRACRRAAETIDPRTPELLFEGEAKEVERRAAVEKARTETEASLEATLSEIEKVQAQTPRSPKEIDAYNKRVKRIEQKRDEATTKLRDLAVDAIQGDAVLGAVVGALATVLDRLPDGTANGALALAAERWGGPKASVDRRIRRVDLLAALTRTPTGPALRAIAMDAAEDLRVRTVALAARVTRADAGAFDDCVAALEGPPTPLSAAAVDGLRRLHRRESIEPLIAYLGREDIGRLRADARRALVSLTGERHGPYKQPWADWWKDAQAKFQLPATPFDATAESSHDKGVTFYGITTFSDKILFVLDVSGSMADTAHEDATGARGEERKIDVARRELASALAMLDEKKTFNMVFFGHRVVRWQGGMIPADKAALERAKRFENEVDPSGGTNIHDALETAFAMAGFAADGKNYLSAIDTVYFMTDGTPTAGKLVKPDEILAAVRAWNRAARITIHVIGVGDACDVKFLQALASQNDGTFVHR